MSDMGSSASIASMEPEVIASGAATTESATTGTARDAKILMMDDDDDEVIFLKVQGGTPQKDDDESFCEIVGDPVVTPMKATSMDPVANLGTEDTSLVTVHLKTSSLATSKPPNKTVERPKGGTTTTPAPLTTSDSPDDLDLAVAETVRPAKEKASSTSCESAEAEEPPSIEETRRKGPRNEMATARPPQVLPTTLKSTVTPPSSAAENTDDSSSGIPEDDRKPAAKSTKELEKDHEDDLSSDDESESEDSDSPSEQDNQGAVRKRYYARKAILRPQLKEITAWARHVGIYCETTGTIQPESPSEPSDDGTFADPKEYLPGFTWDSRKNRYVRDKEEQTANNLDQFDTEIDKVANDKASTATSKSATTESPTRSRDSMTGSAADSTLDGAVATLAHLPDGNGKPAAMSKAELEKLYEDESSVDFSMVASDAEESVNSLYRTYSGARRKEQNTEARSSKRRRPDGKSSCDLLCKSGMPRRAQETIEWARRASRYCELDGSIKPAKQANQSADGTFQDPKEKWPLVGFVWSPRENCYMPDNRKRAAVELPPRVQDDCPVQSVPATMPKQGRPEAYKKRERRLEQSTVVTAANLAFDASPSVREAAHSGRVRLLKGDQKLILLPSSELELKLDGIRFKQPHGRAPRFFKWMPNFGYYSFIDFDPHEHLASRMGEKPATLRNNKTKRDWIATNRSASLAHVRDSLALARDSGSDDQSDNEKSLSFTETNRTSARNKRKHPRAPRIDTKTAYGQSLKRCVASNGDRNDRSHVSQVSAGTPAGSRQRKEDRVHMDLDFAATEQPLSTKRGARQDDSQESASESEVLASKRSRPLPEHLATNPAAARLTQENSAKIEPAPENPAHGRALGTEAVSVWQQWKKKIKKVWFTSSDIPPSNAFNVVMREQDGDRAHDELKEFIETLYENDFGGGDFDKITERALFLFDQLKLE